MNEIQVLDKVFDLYIPYDEITRRIDSMTERMTADLEGKNPLFVVMLNGAFMFASELLQRLNFAAEVSFVKMSSYVGTQSSGKVQQLIGLTDNIVGRDIVIIEDIVESGLTMHYMLDMLKNQGAGSVRIAAMFVKPHCMQYDVKIDYPIMEIGDNFIVGFGLDYNGYGRNLKSVYKLK